MEAVSFAWNAVIKDFGAIALPIAVACFVMILPSTAISMMRGLVVGILAGSGAVDENTMQLANLVLAPISGVVNLVSQAFFMGGIVSFGLAVARGRKPEFGEVFSGGKTFGQLLVANLLFSMAAGLGFMLCIVPGVIFFLGCQFFYPEVVDKQKGAVDALKRSWEITNGHKMNLFVLALVLFGVGLLGLAACCVGALLVAGPVAVIAMAYTYLKLTGEEPTPLV
jgi:uncharacterized membrane protein